jgi:hypothetical protein
MWARLGWLAIVSCAGGGWALAASGCGSDASAPVAPLAYLHAREALILSDKSTLPVLTARFAEIHDELVRGCGGILRRAPSGTRRSAVETELTLVLSVTAFHLRTGPLTRFDEATSGLAWQSAPLARLVRLLTEQVRSNLMLRIPGVCSDLRAWVRSGYGRLPRGTRRFLHDAESASSIGFDEETATGTPLTGISETIARMLRRDVPASGRALLRQVESLEATVGQEEQHVLGVGVSRVRQAVGAGR